MALKLSICDLVSDCIKSTGISDIKSEESVRTLLCKLVLSMKNPRRTLDRRTLDKKEEPKRKEGRMEERTLGKTPGRKEEPWKQRNEGS